jgi:hypothetical protein
MHRKRPHIPPRGHGRVWGMRHWADLAPVAFLAGAAATLPSFIDRRITKRTGNNEPPHHQTHR